MDGTQIQQREQVQSGPETNPSFHPERMRATWTPEPAAFTRDLSRPVEPIGSKKMRFQLGAHVQFYRRHPPSSHVVNPKCKKTQWRIVGGKEVEPFPGGGAKIKWTQEEDTQIMGFRKDGQSWEKNSATASEDAVRPAVGCDTRTISKDTQLTRPTALLLHCHRPGHTIHYWSLHQRRRLRFQLLRLQLGQVCGSYRRPGA